MSALIDNMVSINIIILIPLKKSLHIIIYVYYYKLE